MGSLGSYPVLIQTARGIVGSRGRQGNSMVNGEDNCYLGL